MKIDIGISEKQLQKSIDLLTITLADEMTLYIKTRKFHWNVSGESFMEMHKLFQDQYTELEETIDLVAERIGKLGSKTIGTMNEFSKCTSIKEHPNKYVSTKEMIKELLKDHETIISNTRKGIEVTLDKSNDIGTIDFLTGIIEQHESIAWILRKYN